MRYTAVALMSATLFCAETPLAAAAKPRAEDTLQAGSILSPADEVYAHTPANPYAHTDRNWIRTMFYSGVKLVQEGVIMAATMEVAFGDEPFGEPLLHRRLDVPEALLAEGRFMGVLRVGDVTGGHRPDFVIYQSADDGMKPCFLAALNLDGELLWQHGRRGGQPARPGEVAVYDLTGDGRDEIVCVFLHDPQVQGSGTDMRNTVLQVREGLNVFNPCDRYVWLYTPAPATGNPFTRYRPTSRQYNVRLMD